MTVLDISLTVSPAMLTWPGDPAVGVEQTRTLHSDGANVSEIRLGSHTGTHVDPPAHFIEGGATVDALPLEALVGPCAVVDARAASILDEATLRALDVPLETRLLFRTRNSELWTRAETPDFPAKYVHFTPDGARWLVARGIALVGTDFLSVERKGSPGHPTHMAFLQAGVVIVEGLDLSRAAPGRYTLACLPMKIEGGDGAPARAVLIAE